jgi:putative FmdB family regulatory protein
MPLYDYKCKSCGFKDTVFMAISSCTEESRVQDCPHCQHPAFTRQVSLSNTPLTEFHKPIEMQSVAATSWDELHELQRKCPDIQMSTDLNDPMFGVPIVKNRAEKKQVLAATGYVESN